MKQTIGLLKNALHLILAILLPVVLFSCMHSNKHQAAKDKDTTFDYIFDRYKVLEDYYNNDQHDSLEAGVPEVLDLCRENKQFKLYYTVWGLLAEDYIFRNEYKKSISTAQEMIQDAESRGNSFGMSQAYYILGLAHNLQNNHNESARYFEQAIKTYDYRKGEISFLCTLYCRYAEELLNIDAPDSKIESLMKCWKDSLNNYPLYGVKDNSNRSEWYAKYYIFLKDYLIEKGRYREALAAIDSSEHCVKMAGSEVIDVVNILVGRADILRLLNENQTALKCVDSAQVIIDSHKQAYGVNTSSQQMMIDKVHYEILAELGQYREAYNIKERYDSIDDAYKSQEMQQQLEELNRHLKLDEMRKQNEQLQQRSRFTTGGVAMILGIIALLVFLASSNKWRHTLEVKNRQLERERNVVVAQNKQLAVERDRAEAASKAKTAFLQSMTHEIRTPLNAISGFSQVLTMPDLNLPEKERLDYSERIQDNTRMLTNILDDLILISNLESSTELPPAELCMPLVIIAGAIEAASPLVTKDVTINSNCDMPETETIMTYPNMINIALSKLLDNAAKFTKQGSITLNLCQEDNKMHFSVSDTGPGIPADKKDYIFERFTKLDSFTQGTGLGLSIARMVTEHLGGTLTLDTEYNQGAKFDMIIPFTQQA